MSKVDLQTIKSTNLAAVGYDKHSQTLRILFLAGVTYDYEQVPQGLYAALMAAQSKGEFFREYIKEHYRFTKVNPAKERITMKKQAAPAPTPAAATVAAPTPAQPSKQEATIAKLKDAWIERKVDLSKMQVKQDGKFVLITVADGWPVVQIGASGGIVLPEIHSYPKAFDAAVDGLAVYTKQKERDAKKATTVAVAPTPTPAQPKAETPAAKKAKAHAQLEQTLSA